MRAATGGGKLSVVDAADARAEFRQRFRGGACTMRAATGGGGGGELFPWLMRLTLVQNFVNDCLRV